MVIKFKKLNENAIVPVKAHRTDAGYDLTATSVNEDERGLLVYGTGIAVDIPQGYVGNLHARSSIAKYGLVLTNGVGVIDAGYHGEILMKFVKTGNGNVYQVGDRIGQLLIQKVEDVFWEETTTLGDSERGTGGYGSTGI